MTTRAELAHLVDHTLLAPTAAPAEVVALAAEAAELGAYSICVSPSMLPLGVALGPLKLATVCGFPSGKHTPAAKAFEAAESVAHGADEIDMVIDIGRLKAGDAAHTEAEIRAVREAVPAPTLLKVIIESAGADFVKTSTGFHPSGGASVHAIALMAKTVGGRLGVKASGGIRDWATATAMVDAGATRLGLSGTRAVLDGGTSEGY